jgi:hypothetical protein
MHVISKKHSYGTYTFYDFNWHDFWVVPCRDTGIASLCIFVGVFHFNCSQASHNTSTIPCNQTYRILNNHGYHIQVTAKNYTYSKNSFIVVTRCPYESISIYLDTWHWYKLATMHVEFPDQLDGKLNIQHCDIFYLEARYTHRFFGNFRQICTNESYKCMHKVVINIWIYLYLSIF